jgi:hypothetical protein
MHIGKRPEPGTLLKKHTSPKKAQNSKWREEREGMDQKHVKNVRDCPCCVPTCSRRRAGTIHHLKDVKEERGASVRSTDRFGVPLCGHHHEEVERAGTKNETTWFETHGIDVKGLARALWNARESLKAMIRVVNTHKALANEKSSKAH